MAFPLNNAARDGREEVVRKILEENTGVIVNGEDWDGWTALHQACGGDHDRIVP